MQRFRDCKAFPYRGAYLMERQGRVIETSHSCLVEDEVWIGVYGNTTLVVMDEGEMTSACARYTQEMREIFLS